ncbi:MAG: HTTM domain-containing protein [Marinoscillum sp.]|uniref:HTTM domain-containing protein n=1 Tax=Marinoscillum sp. TaxID=2024838 RepID=UPI003304E8CF
MLRSKSMLAERLVTAKVSIAPLVTFRLLFGLLMLASVIRFCAYGWIHQQYIAPRVYFPFLPGVEPLPGVGMYAVFFVMALASAGIALGWFYRISTATFFVLFTYVELIDKTNYLNHYYFLSLIAFLLIWMPAHGDFSMDVRRGARRATDHVPVGFMNVLRFQLMVVYFFAGLAKINSDWLLSAQPMKMWLSANTHRPVLGPILRYKLTAYVFSWFGMVYDLSIAFFLSLNVTRRFAFLCVVVFHLMTWWLFPIGMFPFIMIGLTTVFFSPEEHLKVLRQLKSLFRWQDSPDVQNIRISNPLVKLFAVFMALQVLIPLRFLSYPGDVFWTEAGYRFSWRVMLMEKAGSATFYVRDSDTGRQSMVANYEHLTPQQEKMMATQPDMLVQYAHYLHDYYLQQGMTDPIVTADVFVTLNGRPSTRFIDPEVDLSKRSVIGSHSLVLPHTH